MRRATKTQLKRFEERVKSLFVKKMVRGPIHLSGGNEVELIEIFDEIGTKDWVFSTHRNHYHYLLKTGDTQGLMKEIVNGNSMHMYSKKDRFFSSAIVGGCLPIAVGVALALKLREVEGVGVWCFVGDGATDSGRFFESVRYAHEFDLPVTFVVENNWYSCDTHMAERWKWTSGVSDWKTPKVRVYAYEREYPHTGAGEWVCF